MKIWYFLQWQWRQFETWQKFFMLAMFLFGCSISASDSRKVYFITPALCIVGGFVLKWAVYDGIKNAWAKYNKEQEEIVSILKDPK